MITSTTLSSLVGLALSLVFSYVPGLKDKFNELESGQKQAVMGVLLVASAGAVFGLSCAGVVDSVTCDKAGAVGLVEVLVAALVANQSTYLLTKK
jgi:Mg2+/citrate symporter